MKLAQFFISRPIFAGVLSSIILIAGLIALPNLPISEYPEVVPPTVVVKASYPGENRVAQALPKLPEEVQRLGVTTNKASPDLTLVVHLFSPGRRYDMLYLSNFAQLRVKDELARLDGVGDVQIFGAGNYSMRVWLDPDKVASRNLTAGDVVKAIR